MPVSSTEPLLLADLQGVGTGLLGRPGLHIQHLSPSAGIVGRDLRRIEQVKDSVAKEGAKVNRLWATFLDPWAKVVGDLRLQPGPARSKAPPEDRDFGIAGLEPSAPSSLAQLKYLRRLSKDALKEFGAGAGNKVTSLFGLKGTSAGRFMQLGGIALASRAYREVRGQLDPRLDRYTPFHEDSVVVVIGATPVRLQAQVMGMDIGQAATKFAEGDTSGAVGLAVASAADWNPNRTTAYLGISFEF